MILPAEVLFPAETPPAVAAASAAKDPAETRAVLEPGAVREWELAMDPGALSADLAPQVVESANPGMAAEPVARAAAADWDQVPAARVARRHFLHLRFLHQEHLRPR
jgi:hypothetical protein